MRIVCFYLEPTVRVTRDLRRYSMANCASNRLGVHDASTPFDVIDSPADERGVTRLVEAEVDHTDPRWPTKCKSCDYLFVEEDSWQTFTQRLYLRQDTGALCTLAEATPGAMWDAQWYPRKGPDGRCLVVMTPGGEWMVDAPSSSGEPWKRTGEVPKITAHPSILINNRGGPDYHGWLTDGVLIEC